jgi:hypothetical protein
MSAPKIPPAMPDTAMAAAFLRALARWAAKPSVKITTPTGEVAGEELVLVLRALGLLERRSR